jgi:hypothetical protein
MTGLAIQRELSNPDVIYWINEINSFFFRMKVYKHQDGEIPLFNGDPIQTIKRIVNDEIILKKMDPVTRGFMGPIEQCSSLAIPPEGEESFPEKDVNQIISTLEVIQKGDRNQIKIEDIQKSQDILSKFLLIKTGSQRALKG